MQSIFENFQQATSGTSRLFGGTGLGLAIVKQLVEAQGGTVHVTSTPNEGSEFCFKLSFLKTNEQAELVSAVLPSGSHMKNVKVLVVEDLALNQLLMRTLLDDFGFECDIAANGRIAVEKLQRRSYDIVLIFAPSATRVASSALTIASFNATAALFCFVTSLATITTPITLP